MDEPDFPLRVAMRFNQVENVKTATIGSGCLAGILAVCAGKYWGPHPQMTTINTTYIHL